MPNPASLGGNRHSCLGLWVNLIDTEKILAIYNETISSEKRLLVGSVNLHTVFCHKYDEVVREFFNRADLVYVDGMPIVWWLNCLGTPARTQHRATLVDWLPILLQRARDFGWRVYYLGNRPGVTGMVADQFQERLPGLQVRTCHGYFDHRADSLDNRRVVEEVNQFRPDILLVGLGMPLEQAWVLENAARLNASVIHLCGATADYFAGVVRFPPRILGRLGMEGLFRAACEPRRLWRRYFLEPFFLLDLALRDLRRVYGSR